MAVPAHDSRDYEFALKYDIPIIRVVSRTDRSDDDSEPYVDDGIMINSSNSLSGLNINGLSCKDAASKVIDWLESTGHGIKKVSLCSVGTLSSVWQCHCVLFCPILD